MAKDCLSFGLLILCGKAAGLPSRPCWGAHCAPSRAIHFRALVWNCLKETSIYFSICFSSPFSIACGLKQGCCGLFALRPNCPQVIHISLPVPSRVCSFPFLSDTCPSSLHPLNQGRQWSLGVKELALQLATLVF